jgi:hypothetical protein
MIDGSDNLLKKGLGLEFFHIATGTQVKFKAFLNSYEDNFKSDWASERVYGRMDPIHTFQGTDRTITIGWDVPSRDFEDAKKNFTNASKMYSMLYPAYRPESSTQRAGPGLITAPPLLKIKFANLIFDAKGEPSGDAKTAGLLGWISDLSFAPDLDAGFFDEEPGFLIPQTIKLNCTFNVLHTHELGWNSSTKKLRKTKGNFPYNNAVSENKSDETLGAPNRNEEGDPTEPGQTSTPADKVNETPINEAGELEVFNGSFDGRWD